MEMLKIDELFPIETFKWLERIRSFKSALSTPPANGWYNRNGLLMEWFLGLVYRSNWLPGNPNNYLLGTGCTELQLLRATIDQVNKRVASYIGKEIWITMNKLAGRCALIYLDTLQSNFDSLKPFLIESGKFTGDELDSLFRSTFILDKEVYPQVIPSNFDWFKRVDISEPHPAFSMVNEIADTSLGSLGSKVLLGPHKNIYRFERDVESGEFFDNFNSPAISASFYRKS